MKSRTSQVESWKGKRPRRGRKLRVEQLERRDLMTASPFDPSQFDLESSPVVTLSGGSVAAGPSAALHPLSSIPSLHSDPNATATLVLDFDGNFLPVWGGYTNVLTPVYDIDGDETTFSDEELANIREIWARVAEDYAPFNINVTTDDRFGLSDGIVAKIAIGGSYEDWLLSPAGGVAYRGGFYNFAPNVGFAFTDNLGNGFAKYTAEAVSHEAGHLFGLTHQSLWSGGRLVEEYNPGNANWAPIMGVGYNSAVVTWSNGRTPNSRDSYQDDMSILSGGNNGFGYRVNSIGTLETAGSLGNTGTVDLKGIVARNSDYHWYQFATDGGNVSFNVNTIDVGGIDAGANFDSVLEIRDFAGRVLFTSDSTFTLNSSVNLPLAEGIYYAVVRSTGVYGYVGQYTLTGSFVPATPLPPSVPPLPEITVLLGGTEVVDNGSISFGTTSIGAFVDRTFTIRNDSGGTLALDPINTQYLPAGFSIVSNIGAIALLAGESTTFTVRMTAASAGTFSGVIRFVNNDADEAVYDINVSGDVTPAPPLVTLSTVDNGDAGYVSSGAWATNVGAGYSNDFSFAQATAATSIARWTAINLAPGTYRIAATWLAFAKAASNARFYFGDDTGTLGSKVVNQRVLPTGFSANGAVWQTIATVTITAGHQQLWLQLNNKNVNGFVVADAVRFERITPPASSLPSAAAPSPNGALAQSLADDAMSQWTGKKKK